jgi:hypothetical protein
MQYILIGILSFLFVFHVHETQAKPFNNDGICETIIFEDGKVTSKESYPCE